jgi:pimeloyl-ACP methyl ester carboxylesterase
VCCALQEGFLAATLESKHFVLVHGGGLGAWCWYKSIALLEESGFVATAVDLAGSGIEPTDPNQITSLAQYVKPLVELLENLAGTEKVLFCFLGFFLPHCISVA